MKFYVAAHNGVVVNTRRVDDSEPPYTHALVVEGANGPFATFFYSRRRACDRRDRFWSSHATHIVRVDESPVDLPPGAAYPVARRSDRAARSQPTL